MHDADKIMVGLVVIAFTILATGVTTYLALTKLYYTLKLVG